MSNPSSTLLLLSLAAFAVGCADDDERPVDPPGTDVIDPLVGFPFSYGAVAISDLCSNGFSQSCTEAQYPLPSRTSAGISQPEPGTLCFQGRVKDGGGIAAVIIPLSTYKAGPTQGTALVVDALDAEKRGITQLSFTLEGVPDNGMTLYVDTIKQWSCAGDNSSNECRAGGFAYMADPTQGTRETFAEPGAYVAPLTSFVQEDPAHGTRTFDTSALAGVGFMVKSGGFDFCISDFRFLDAEGNEVTP